MATTEVQPRAGTQSREKPAWLAALDGLCRPCADAEFYGLRMRHADCEHGGCRCGYVIPDAWAPGTWKTRAA